MAKHDETHRKATSQDDARLPATTRPNIDEPPHAHDHQSQSDDAGAGESKSGQSQSNTAKDINVVRGDERPQSVRNGG